MVKAEGYEVEAWQQFDNVQLQRTDVYIIQNF